MSADRKQEREKRREQSIHEAAWRVGDAPKTREPKPLQPSSKRGYYIEVDTVTLKNLNKLKEIAESGLLDSDPNE
jgi:hypothetical protein